MEEEKAIECHPLIDSFEIDMAILEFFFEIFPLDVPSRLQRVGFGGELRMCKCGRYLCQNQNPEMKQDGK